MSKLHEVETLLIQVMAHMLQAEMWPLSRGAPKCLVEARGFRAQARRRFMASPTCANISKLPIFTGWPWPVWRRGWTGSRPYRCRWSAR